MMANNPTSIYSPEFIYLMGDYRSATPKAAREQCRTIITHIDQYVAAQVSAALATPPAPAAANNAADDKPPQRCTDDMAAAFIDEWMGATVGYDWPKDKFERIREAIDAALEEGIENAAIAGDRAARPVANKAEVTIEVPAQWLRNLAELRPEVYTHDGLVTVTRAFCNTADDYSAGITPVFATPPATTGASTAIPAEVAAALGLSESASIEDAVKSIRTVQRNAFLAPVGASTVLTDERIDIIINELKPSDNYPQLRNFARAIAREVSAQAGQVAVPDEQLEWSHDLQERLIAAGQDFDEHESVRQIMAEAACLLAALTGVKAPTSGERQEGGAS